MTSWVQKLFSFFGSRNPPAKIAEFDFVSDTPKQRETAGRASLLPSGLTPGFHFSGTLNYTRHVHSSHGEVTIGSDKKYYPEYDGLKVVLRPLRWEQPQEMRRRAEKHLKKLYFESLKACLSKEGSDHEAGRLAVRLLFRLLHRDRLDAAESEMLEYLKLHPIFPCYQQDYSHLPGHTELPPSPRLLSLNLLLKASNIYLSPEDTGPYQDTIEPFEEGRYNFEVSPEMAGICSYFELPVEFATEAIRRRFSPDTAPPPPPPPPPDPEEEEAKALDPLAVAAHFGQARLRNNCLTVPTKPQLTIDFSAGTLTGFGIDKRTVTLKLRDLKDVRLLRYEVQGDTKIHEYRYLVVTDGREKLVYKERFKEYYERSPVDDLDRYQEKARSVLDCLGDLRNPQLAQTRLRDLLA